MHKSLIIVTLLIVASVAFFHQHKKNVIYMVGDGFGANHYSFFQKVSEEIGLDDPELLNILDPHNRGLLNHEAADHDIPTSASGATQLSCAVMANNEELGYDASSGEACGTILEAAKLSGKKTGLVTNQKVSHSTPGGFSSHTTDRDNEELTTLQQVAVSPFTSFDFVDVMIGGGSETFEERETDTRNITAEAVAAHGYTVVRDRAGIQAVDATNACNQMPFLGLLDDGGMDIYLDIHIHDRVGSPQASLAEMTQAALHLLSCGNTEGFFLMVEGARIDQQSHDNDPVGTYYEILQFLEAVKVVLDWVEIDNQNAPFFFKDIRNFVMITADHETGGFSIARDPRSDDYTVDDAIDDYDFSLFSSMNHSVKWLRSQSAPVGVDDVTDPVEYADILAEYGIFVTSAEAQIIIDDFAGSRAAGEARLGRFAAREMLMGYTTQGHAANPVPYYIPYGDPFHFVSGNMHQTEMTEKIAILRGLDLVAATVDAVANCGVNCV